MTMAARDAALKSGILQSPRERQGFLAEFAICKAAVFARAVSLDQTHFVWPAFNARSQGLAEAVVFS